MGRLAWQFVGSGLEDQWAAIIISLVQSARMNGERSRGGVAALLSRRLHAP